MSLNHPTRAEILAEVQRVREGTQAHRHLPFARHALRVPMEDFYALSQLIPGLTAKDPDERTRAWEWFERSAFGEPYRVGRISRGLVRQGVIAK